MDQQPNECMYQPNFLHQNDRGGLNNVLQTQVQRNQWIVRQSDGQVVQVPVVNMMPECRQSLMNNNDVMIVDPSSISLNQPFIDAHQQRLADGHKSWMEPICQTPRTKRPTGTTAARLLAEQFNKSRRNHSVQTETVDNLQKKRKIRRPPKKTDCQLCHTLVPENQRDRHVLRYHLKKPIYRCPLCDFSSNAEPSIVRTHLRLKHREFDLSPVNCRQDYVGELSPLMRQCFGPKKRAIRSVDDTKKCGTEKKKRPKVQVDEQVQCQLCVATTLVRSDEARIHAAQCHLHMKHLYACPQTECDFGSFKSLELVKRHALRMHGLKERVVPKGRHIHSELKKCVIDCFGVDVWNALFN